MMLGDVGDILLATPALRLLRATYPDARITAMTKPTTVVVLEGSGLVDAVLPIQKHIFDKPSSLLHLIVVWRLLHFVLALRRERFDTVIVLHHLVTVWGTLKYGLLSLATGARRRAGLDNGRGVFLTHTALDLGYNAMHESQYWLRVVVALAAPRRRRGIAAVLYASRAYRTAPVAAETIIAPGITAAPDGLMPPVFATPGAAQARADYLLREAGVVPDGRFLVVHPGSGSYSVARRWAPERFAAAADLLAGRHGLQVVVVGGLDEVALAQDVAARMRTPSFVLAGQTTLPELAGVLRRAALVIGNDSGVAHLASAVGAPVAAVFGPFNHHAWRPLGRSLVVRAAPALPCMPCSNRDIGRGYPEGCPPRYCLREVSPAQVVRAAEFLLQSPS